MAASLIKNSLDLSVAPMVPRKGLIRAGDAKTIRCRLGATYFDLPVLISAKVLKSRIRNLAKEIIRDVRVSSCDEVNLVAVLQGASVFAHELAGQISALRGPRVSLRCISVSSYGNGTCSSGSVRIVGQPLAAIGRNLIIVEDIVDSGRTIAALKRFLGDEKHAESIKVCTLMNKPSRRLRRLKNISNPDYIGFQIPDVFVVGFGLDYGEMFRELPCVASVDGQLKEIDDNTATLV